LVRCAQVGGIYFELLRQVHRHRMAGAIIGPSIASQIFPGIKEFVERYVTSGQKITHAACISCRLICVLLFRDWKLAQLRVRNDVNEISSASADLRTQLCILKLRLTADQLAGLPEMITKVLDPGQHSLRRETYVDWFMVPPCVDIDNLGDDQFIKCRLLGSKCFVIASDRVVEGNFIINKRVDFEVSTATINGLKSLGYVITVSFKRTSTLYSDGKLTLSIDEIRELGQTFLQIKGERKSDLAAAAADLGLDMSADAETSSYCMLCQAANLGTTTVPRPVELSVDSETRSADATRTEVAVLSPEEGNRALSVLELLGLPGLHDDTESDNDEDGDSAARAGEEIELLADPGGKSDDAAASKASGALDSDAGPNSQPAESNGLPTPAFTEGLDRGESRFSSSPLSPLSSQRDVEEDKTEFDNCPPRPSIQRATRFL
jgi:adenylate cyclase class IV